MMEGLTGRQGDYIREAQRARSFKASIDLLTFI